MDAVIAQMTKVMIDSGMDFMAWLPAPEEGGETINAHHLLFTFLPSL